MSKGLGQKIVIKFTEDLIGDIGNVDAFTVTGKEYKYVRGPLIDVTYQLDSVERYPVEGLEEAEAPQNIILLTTNIFSRFNNIEGELTVCYDAEKGTLSGEGGTVKSFEHSFTPTDLVPVPNPGVEENITAVISNFTATFISACYISGRGNETIAASPDIAVNFERVEVINP